MVNFTFEDLQDLQDREKSMFTDIAHIAEELEISPKESTIKNILNYSRALSVRESKTIKQVEMILN
ncbi:MAG: hypothetical protein HKN39_02000 [Flavobacteriales bacterium]|nr:hypothetical protein [Flavobacteriales bacterium]